MANQTKRELIISNMKLSNQLARAEKRIRDLEKYASDSNGYIRELEKYASASNGYINLLEK